MCYVTLQTGLTPLMEAASGGYVEVGRVLLDKGADVNAPPVPSSRDTALTIAADKGHFRFVELLILRYMMCFVISYISLLFQFNFEITKLFSKVY